MEDQVLKKAAKISLAALGILLAGALFFYKERMLFADASYILFNIINNENVSIQLNRYGSFITQLVPYIGAKFHWPIKQLLIGYSASFNLFYFLVAYILVHKYNQYRLAILMTLYYFLVVSASYFWPNNEIHQAIAWMFLLFGTTLYLGNKKAHIIAIIISFSLLAFLTIFTHFVVLIPLIFLWVYFIIEQKNWPFPKKSTILLSLVLVIIIVLKCINSISTTLLYESNHLHNLTHFSLKDILHTFNTPVVQMFAYRCVINYWIVLPISIIGLFIHIQKKQTLLATWICVSTLGYFIIIGLIYGGFDKYILLFHIESEWASIGIITATAFVFSFLPTLGSRKAALILGIIFCVRLLYIGNSSRSFTQRIYITEQVIKRMRQKGITKLALVQNPVLLKQMKLFWGLPYETIILSALQNDDPQSTFFLLNKDDKKALTEIQTKNGFYNSNGVEKGNTLNQIYLRIDTTVPYQVMTYEQLMQ